jgi:hypothetical protein
MRNVRRRRAKEVSRGRLAAHPKQRKTLEEDIPPLLDALELVEVCQLAEWVEGAEALSEFDERHMITAQLLIFLSYHRRFERLLFSCSGERHVSRSTGGQTPLGTHDVHAE